MKVPKKIQSGFTLIEIIIVIGIMAVLTVIVYGSFGTARTQSRDNQKITDINTIQLGLEQYFNQNHQYPTDLLALSSQYIPASLSVSQYKYFPLTRVAPNSLLCTSYQLSATLEQNNSYLQSKKGFDSSNLPTTPTTGATYECGTGHLGVNASLTNPNGALIYDVIPQ